MTFGVAQLMHKEKQRDMTWTTSFMHIHDPPAQVTEVIQHRGDAACPTGLAELIRQPMVHNSCGHISCVKSLMYLTSMIIFYFFSVGRMQLILGLKQGIQQRV